jgi:putative nucleotidyltransferase with HDIG domain
MSNIKILNTYHTDPEFKSKYSKLTDLLDLEIIQELIYDSDLKNYTDLNVIQPEQIKIFLINCIKIIETKPKLLEQFILESENYEKTKYHKENLITHLVCVGWICSLFSTKYGLEKEYAFQLGFFHDIGKPWAKKFIQTKKKIISNSKGHSQIGENICFELGLDKKISWCVSNHMCSCCHQNNELSHWEYIWALQTISIITPNRLNEIVQYSKTLACLMIGDDLGRLGEHEKNYQNTISHSDSWLNWIQNQIEKFNPTKHSVKFLGSLHPDNSIVVQMYGCSGFGKSTTAKNIIEILNLNGITWEYAERDKSYYQVYADSNNLDIEHVINSIVYKQVYNWIESNDLKYKVQKDWVNQLNSILDSDSKVKIIDSVQLLYPKSWESTLESLNPDAYSVWVSSIKLGYYGFPQSLYGRTFEPKTGKYELIPRPVSDNLTWPNLNSELDKSQKFNPNQIDIAYGSVDFLINSIINYNTYSTLYMPEKQVHLINMIEQFEQLNPTKITSKSIQEYICGQFPPGIVLSNEEISYFGNHLIRFTYKDGMQIFNGPSRDYRGETILFNSSDLKYNIGRVSLPVFPDHVSLRKDPAAEELIKTTTKFHIVPKFDGSLFVLALVKTNTPEYKIILNLAKQTCSEAYFINELGIWCFGSKGCMFAKNQYGERGALSRIINSIKASYGSIDNFVLMVSQEIKSNGYADTYPNISLIFEAIDSNPTDELTVDYGRAFCPFLCWVLWDGSKKSIGLPNNISFLNPVAPIYTVESWDKVIEFKDQAHLRLLQGSETDEPEGYVVWLGDSNIGIKLKHPEYYIAHKPYSKKNIEMAKKIEFDEEYSKLKNRLLKFKPKPPIKELVGKNLDYILDLFLDNYKHINSRKNWALFWKDDKNNKEVNEILEIIENSVIVFYPQFQKTITDKGFTIAMDYFDKRDEWIVYFYSKYLKN